ncbi:MAG: hypothetical protein HY833_02055 [Candidatus Aenigmarchaeota archaeon]|nr:hypothetical protein [Candidatus Aenigmarchaeota archaeon]
MFNVDWGNISYSQQVGYLSQMMHVVASEMEMGYGANSEGEIMGATVSILGSVPNTSISTFYGNRPHLLQDQMRRAMERLRDYGQVSKQDDGEVLSVAPQLPEIEGFVRDVLETYSRDLKNSHSHIYDGVNADGSATPYAGATRFHR